MAVQKAPSSFKRDVLIVLSTALLCFAIAIQVSDVYNWIVENAGNFYYSDSFSTFRHLTSNYKWLWNTVNKIDWISRKLMRFIILAGSRYVHYPPNWDTSHPYPSWQTWQDHSYYARALPPREDWKTAPLTNATPEELAAKFFARRKFKPEKGRNSNVLFVFFAQWFVEQFFKSGLNASVSLENENKRFWKTYTQNAIDLTNLYGHTEERTKGLRSFKDGKLKSQFINGEEFPPFEEDLNGEVPMVHPPGANTKGKFFALGHPRFNFHPGLILINTIMLREHNSLCDLLKRAYPSWDDERLFQTARLTLTAMLLKMTVEDYIQHIAPIYFRLRFDPTIVHEYAGKWQYGVRIHFEFNLLYRWHGLVPDDIQVNGSKVPFLEAQWNPELLVKHGALPILKGIVNQPAGEIGKHNSPDWLAFLDAVSIKHARELNLKTYNDYRERFGLSRLRSFDQFTSDTKLAAELKEVYGSIDNLEYYVGLFLEDKDEGSMFPKLLTEMVLGYAMTGIFGNPITSPHLWKVDTFSEVGWKEIHEVSFAKLVSRNVKGLKEEDVRFTVN